MLKLLFVLPMLLLGFSTFGQENDFKLPESWTEDFKIVLSYASSMGSGKTKIKFSFDSCTYSIQPHRSKKPKNGSFKLREADRSAILKKLSALKVDQVKSEPRIHAALDGWSQSICLDTYCIEGGTSVTMSTNDKNSFLDAYRYLEDFAAKKGRSN